MIFGVLTLKFQIMKKNLLLMLSLTITITAFAQISLVKNLNPTTNNGIFNEIIVFNNRVYFAGNNSSNGINWELFASDGTNAGTVLVKEISPGTNSGGGPQEFYVWSNTNELYFSANGGSSATNTELWKTDGTTSGTVKVSEFDPAGSGSPSDIIGFNNNLYMMIREGSIGYELGKSNGTLAGSTILKDIRPGNLSSTPRDFFIFNNKLYFAANDGLPGRELWTTNGTTAGTVVFKDINNNGGSNPTEFTAFNGMFYFSAETVANGRELWRSNGTAAGTVLVQDINSGTANSSPENLTVFNNRLYFTATTSIFGKELYYIGTTGGVALAQDIQPLAASSNPSDLYVFNGKLYFTAGDGVNGRELWVSDGTIPGTVMLKDINPSGSSNPKNFKEYNGRLYFSANNTLWSTDGTTAGTVQIPNSPDEPENLVVLNDLLLFKADGGTGIGRELYSYTDPSLSVADLDMESNIKVYPNPVLERFSVESLVDIERLDIYDLLGKKVKTFENSRDYYNIEDLANGAYILKVKSDRGTSSIKLIKD